MVLYFSFPVNVFQIFIFLIERAKLQIKKAVPAIEPTNNLIENTSSNIALLFLIYLFPKSRKQILDKQINFV